MENRQQIVADQFWKDHFSQWLDTPLTESKAIESEFWIILQDKLASVDERTAWAVALAKPIIKITSPNMHFKISRLAKQESDRKHYHTDERDTKRREELGLD